MARLSTLAALRPERPEEPLELAPPVCRAYFMLLSSPRFSSNQTTLLYNNTIMNMGAIMSTATDRRNLKYV